MLGGVVVATKLFFRLKGFMKKDLKKVTRQKLVLLSFTVLVPKQNLVLILINLCIED